MKKALLTICALCATFAAQAVTVLEYDIASLNGTASLPAAPTTNLLNASSLSYSGTAGGAGVGQVGSTGWQVAANAAAVDPNGPQMYSFTVTSTAVDFDFSAASISFGASTQNEGNMAVFANNALVGSVSLGDNAFSNQSISLASLGTVSTGNSVTFKLVGWGTADPGYLGLDTGLTPGTFQNLQIADVTAPGGSPIPEPHEYAMIAAVGLLGFAAYRRRRQATETQA